MSELVLLPEKGRKTSGDELRMPPGFMEKCINAAYLPEDEDILHKILGRTSTGSLPGAATTSNTKGLAFGGYENTADQIFLLANTQLYKADAGATLSGWTDVADQDATAFVASGGFVKAIPDTLKRNILFTGAVSERAVVVDEDGHARYLSLKKPAAPTVAAITGTPTIIRPNAATAPATVDAGTVTANFANTGNAFDADTDTYASKETDGAAIVASDWEFATAVLGSDHKLYVKYAVSSLPPIDVDFDPGSESSGSIDEPVDALLIIQVSTDNAVSFTTIYSNSAPVSAATLQFDVANAQQMDEFIVRVVLHYRSGTAQVSPYVFDIRLAEDTAGNASVIDAGTVYYAQTEIFTVTLANGKTIVVESAPSDTVSVAMDGSADTGVTVTLGARANLNSDGTKDDPTNSRLLKRRVYRSTGSGTYPDLGQIADSIAIDATTYIDDFETGISTLGSPGLQVVYVGSGPFPLAGQSPAFLDATLHKGSVVGISKDDPYRIKWSPPGFPDYFPVPHDFAIGSPAENEPFAGITSVGETVIVWQRGRVLRIRDLPMATLPNFGTENLEVEELSPSEGLAGTPLAYTHFHSQKGHRVVAWVSDNGIWMTDGTKPSERGLGVIKLSTHQYWKRDVDTARLAECSLIFDPILEALVFDFYDRDGNLQTLYVHTAPLHWVRSGEDQMIPKWSGPHDLTAVARVTGVTGGVRKHWSLSSADLKIYNERTGTDNAGSDILTHIEWWWTYPVGPRKEFQIYDGDLYHSDWGPGEVCDVEIHVRNEEIGEVQLENRKGLSLSGARTTDIGFLNASGGAIKAIIRHLGKTVSDGSTKKTFGPLVIETEEMDETREG